MWKYHWTHSSYWTDGCAVKNIIIRNSGGKKWKIINLLKLLLVNRTVMLLSRRNHKLWIWNKIKTLLLWFFCTISQQNVKSLKCHAQYKLPTNAATYTDIQRHTYIEYTTPRTIIYTLLAFRASTQRQARASKRLTRNSGSIDIQTSASSSVSTVIASDLSTVQTITNR